MPKKPKNEIVVGQYFTWIVGPRSGVWYADGRSNKPAPGRHSLGSKDRSEAIAALRQLDLVQAVRLGLADRSLLLDSKDPTLTLEEGWELYRQHESRPRVMGGAKSVSVKRYKAIFDKFIPWARSQGITTWAQVTTGVLTRYATWLVANGYAPRTQVIELTTLKQAINWLQLSGHLRTTLQVQLTLSKPVGTDTYCWTPEEVAAIIAHCRKTSGLEWLANVLTALASTGLRISELAGLRWSDIDLPNNLIHLTDESGRSHRKSKRRRRETKSGRSRSFPISGELSDVLKQMGPKTEGIVFQKPRGGVLKSDSVRVILIRDVLGPLGKRFKSPSDNPGFKDGRLHSFRHYFCSACANKGIPEAVVMKWLGHRDSAMVKHYYHLHDAEAQRQMRRMKFIGNPDDTVSEG